MSFKIKNIIIGIKLKNIALLSVYVLSLIPMIIYNHFPNYELSLGVFIERPTRIDWFFKHYILIIQFGVLTYCLKFPKGIDERVKTTLVIITILDFIDSVLFSKMYFPILKIIIGMSFGFRQSIYNFTIKINGRVFKNKN